MAIEDAHRRIFGLQYHPEVVHSERGFSLLKHFLLSISEMKPDWGMDSVLEEQSRVIEQKVCSCDELIAGDVGKYHLEPPVLSVVKAVVSY